MALEIERKFLVKDMSFRDMSRSSLKIRQGYLNRIPERTVRVRIRGEKGYLTIKGINNGITRKEFEYEIPFADAQELLDLCELPVLEKERYIVDYKGFVWEVDCFYGKNEGLVTAEIELPSEDTEFPIPAFVGQEVTGNPDYYNSNLCK